ncbi:MAG: hypothetical protein K2X81_00240 [Candidatus Obscuribacterales bacterium]|nr:hypothetical protein [Candidatus Obscuribacterales bacterium]
MTWQLDSRYLWVGLIIMVLFSVAGTPCSAQPAPKSSADAKLLAPIRLVENYVSTSYIPSVTWTRSGEGNSREWDLRDYIVYVAGPAGRHLSFWVEPHPLNKPGGFFTKFEMLQGSLYAGNSRRFGLLRGGQIFALENAGFAGADRVITQTQPLMFEETNGFSPSETSKGLSAEVTLPRLTTGKVFFSYYDAAGTEFELEEEAPEANPPPPVAPPHVGEEEEAEETAEAEEAKEETPEPPAVKRINFRRPRTIGFTVEKVFGREGLSGIQSQYVIGYTPVTINGAKSPVRFQQWYLFGNKTFLDKKKFERANLIYGLSVRRDGRFIDSDTDKKSWGYGQFIELDAFLVPSYLTAIARYDQFRPTDRIKNNTQFGFTVGLALDLHGPRRSRGRMTFDYQIIGQEQGRPTQRFILAWRPIF